MHIDKVFSSPLLNFIKTIFNNNEIKIDYAKKFRRYGFGNKEFKKNKFHVIIYFSFMNHCILRDSFYFF